MMPTRTEFGLNSDMAGHGAFLGTHVRIDPGFPQHIVLFQEPDQIRTSPDIAVFWAFLAFRSRRMATTAGQQCDVPATAYIRIKEKAPI